MKLLIVEDDKSLRENTPVFLAGGAWQAVVHGTAKSQM